MSASRIPDSADCTFSSILLTLFFAFSNRLYIAPMSERYSDTLSIALSILSKVAPASLKDITFNASTPNFSAVQFTSGIVIAVCALSLA